MTDIERIEELLDEYIRDVSLSYSSFESYLLRRDDRSRYEKYAKYAKQEMITRTKLMAAIKEAIDGKL